MSRKLSCQQKTLFRGVVIAPTQKSKKADKRSESPALFVSTKVYSSVAAGWFLPFVPCLKPPVAKAKSWMTRGERATSSEQRTSRHGHWTRGWETRVYGGEGGMEGFKGWARWN